MEECARSLPLVTAPSRPPPPKAPHESNCETSSTRQHPSWWRPDLVPSPPIPIQWSLDYRANKTAEKRIAVPNPKDSWNRPEPLRSHQQDPTNEGRSSGRKSSQRWSRRTSSNPLAKVVAQKSLLSRPNSSFRESFAKSSQGRRKRKFEDSFLPERRAENSSREYNMAVHPRRNKTRPSGGFDKLHASNLMEDSQATLSDPNVAAYKAKQVSVSPYHTRVRPFK